MAGKYYTGYDHIGTCPFRYILMVQLHGPLPVTTSIYKVALKWREGMSEW